MKSSRKVVTLVCRKGVEGRPHSTPTLPHSQTNSPSRLSTLPHSPKNRPRNLSTLPHKNPSRLSTLPHSPTNSPGQRSSLPHSQPKVLENFPPHPREAWIEGYLFFLPCLLSDHSTKLTTIQLAQQLGAPVLTWKISTPTSLNMSLNKATPQTTSTCMLLDSH